MESRSSEDRLRLLGELAGTVLHEVRNALVPLRTMVELLPHRHDDAEFRDWVARAATNEIDRIGELVEQLGPLYRRRAPNRAAIDLEPLAATVVRLLDHEARRRGIALTLEAPPGLDPIVGDPAALEQVLLNLVLNALQAVSAAGTVTVRLGRQGASTLVTVEDDGPGIAREDEARIFEPSFTTKPDGSGLGLAIVRGIVEAHGGSVRASNRPQQGSAFTVELPALPEATPRTPPTLALVRKTGP